MEKKNNIKKEKVITINELAVMIKNGFQNTQDHFDKKFHELDSKFEGKIDNLDKNIKEIHKEVQKINLNLVDVVRKEDFDKLETRVVKLEQKSGVSVK